MKLLMSFFMFSGAYHTTIINHLPLFLTMAVSDLLGDRGVSEFDENKTTY